MNPEPPPLPPKKPLTLPVILAFVPAALALLLASLSALPKAQMTPCCILATIISIGCCAISSAMLIKRNTTATLVFGILLGMLNLVISAGLGCAAMLSDFGGNMH
jgi:hypothetical protein